MAKADSLGNWWLGWSCQLPTESGSVLHGRDLTGLTGFPIGGHPLNRHAHCLGCCPLPPLPCHVGRQKAKLRCDPGFVLRRVLGVVIQVKGARLISFRGTSERLSLAGPPRQVPRQREARPRLLRRLVSPRERQVLSEQRISNMQTEVVRTFQDNGHIDLVAELETLDGFGSFAKEVCCG